MTRTMISSEKGTLESPKIRCEQPQMRLVYSWRGRQLFVMGKGSVRASRVFAISSSLGAPESAVSGDTPESQQIAPPVTNREWL